MTKNAEILIIMAKDTGLEANESKIKYMVMNRLGICEGEGDLKVGEFCFQKVNEFRYLGTKINDRNEVWEDDSKTDLLESEGRAYYGWSSRRIELL